MLCVLKIADSQPRNKGFPYFYLCVPTYGDEEARLMRLF